jgi:putative toxin-antitoxin system antitoxin component (TIGR02293 family)
MKHAKSRAQDRVKRMKQTTTENDALGTTDDTIERFYLLSPVEKVRLIREGMHATIFERIAHDLFDIPLDQLLSCLHVPPSSVYRKMSLSTRLSAAESDVAARTLNIYANAKDVLEDGRLASKWLWSENALLQGDRPIETIDTQPGFDRVRDLLMRIEHGVAV